MVASRQICSAQRCVLEMLCRKRTANWDIDFLGRHGVGALRRIAAVMSISGACQNKWLLHSASLTARCENGDSQSGPTLVRRPVRRCGFLGLHLM
jgi:hypothetical protein